MNSPDSVVIIKRFYEALSAVIAKKEIRGVQTFTREHEINRWNFLTVSQNPESDMFQPAWLGYIVKDFGVSAKWLLTGRGNMFSATQKRPIPAKSLQHRNDKGSI